jgi:alanyl-tRNA synthetase
VGYLKILSESAIAAGVRRIEAASGTALVEHVKELFAKQEEQYAALRLRKPDLAPLKTFSGAETPEAIWKCWESREAALKQAAADVAQHDKEEAKRLEAAFQKRATTEVLELIANARTGGEIPLLVHSFGDAPASYLPIFADALKTRWQGVAVLATVDQGKVALLCAVSPAFTKKVQAGKIIQAIAPLVGGKGGGRPELAQGGGADAAGLEKAFEKAVELVEG